MRKARFFEIEVKDGYGQKTIIMPARSGYDAETAVSTPHISAEVIRNFWSEVIVDQDCCGLSGFSAVDDSNSQRITIERDDPGYDYLLHYMADEVSRIYQEEP